MGTALAGKDANIYWDSQGTDTAITQSQSWSLDASHDVAEITSMQDSWKTYAGGFRDWTATVEQILPVAGLDITIDSGNDPNGMGDVSARLELYCRWAPGTNYSVLYGEALCTGASITSDKDDVAKVSYSFQGTGQLIWSSGASRP